MQTLRKRFREARFSGSRCSVEQDVCRFRPAAGGNDALKQFSVFFNDSSVEIPGEGLFCVAFEIDIRERIGGESIEKLCERGIEIQIIIKTCVTAETVLFHKSFPDLRNIAIKRLCNEDNFVVRIGVAVVSIANMEKVFLNKSLNQQNVGFQIAEFQRLLKFCCFTWKELMPIMFYRIFPKCFG